MKALRMTFKSSSFFKGKPPPPKTLSLLHRSRSATRYPKSKTYAHFQFIVDTNNSTFTHAKITPEAHKIIEHGQYMYKHDPNARSSTINF